MDDRIEHLMQELLALKEKRKAQLDGNCGENPILSRDECTELIKRKENYQDQDQKGKNANLSLNVTKAKKFVDGYSSVRKLNEEEKKSLKILCKGAAIRFLLTRVFDYLNLIEGAIVKIKDPVEYLKRLEFHDSVKNYQDYFF